MEIEQKYEQEIEQYYTIITGNNHYSQALNKITNVIEKVKM
jgi:hypothetical protein